MYPYNQSDIIRKRLLLPYSHDSGAPGSLKRRRKIAITGGETDIAEARQLIMNLYGCRTSYIDDVDSIKDVIHMICQCIGAGTMEECYHKFSPMGISAMVVITTSHISIHTWPEYEYAAVDIFSYQEDIPGEIRRLLTESLKAEQAGTRLIKRALNKTKEDVHG